MNEQKELYNLGTKSSDEGLGIISRQAYLGKDADALARQIIDDAGYRVNFGHGLGHSLGLRSS